jgi:hypothetical protein
MPDQKEPANDISTLDKRLDSLPEGQRKLFDRIYHRSVSHPQLCLPDTMKLWVVQQFGSLDVVLNQTVLRLTNNVTGEETVFNSVRRLRPLDNREKEGFAPESLDNTVDIFDNPEVNTPADTFGRIRGKYCVTAGNIAKCDELHSLVIFKDHNPLQFTEAKVLDYLDTAWRWAAAAHRHFPQNKYFFHCWNCLWRSGASINHGHSQMMLARGSHYARIEHLRRAALSYKRRFGANYFDDLYRVHAALGLALEYGDTRLLAYLTPTKNNELIIMSNTYDRAFRKHVYRALAFFRDNLLVQSFNLGLTMPPLAKTRESWQGFPVIAWLVDRGRLDNRSCDWGSLELFATVSVTSDPFQLAEALQSVYNKGI